MLLFCNLTATGSISAISQSVSQQSHILQQKPGARTLNSSTLQQNTYLSALNEQRGNIINIKDNIRSPHKLCFFRCGCVMWCYFIRADTCHKLLHQSDIVLFTAWQIRGGPVVGGSFNLTTEISFSTAGKDLLIIT